MIIPIVSSFILLSLINYSSQLSLTDLTEYQIQQLAHIDSKTLPSRFNAKHGDNSHWCCANDQPATTIQRTRIGANTVNEAFTIITGYVDCGNWLVQNKCPVESVIYQVITKYHIEHYDTPDYQSCPNHHVKCCANYINVAGNCYEPDHITDHLDILVLLGVLSTVKPPQIG